MFNNTKSSFTLKAEETAERASTESSQQLAAFTARTQVGITLAKQMQEARERAQIQQAFQDITQGTAVMAVSLAAASELREPSPTVLSDTVPEKKPKALPSSSTAKQTIEDKITPDNILKEYEKDVKDLEAELSRLDATNDTSEAAYNVWLKQQQDQFHILAEPTAVGFLKFDSYEIWKTKITNHQEKTRNKLLPELTVAQEKYQLSYDELKLAQRNYDVAFHRKHVELTKDHRLSLEEASEYLRVNFKDEKTFYRELRDKDIKRATEHSKHPLAAVIPKLVKGEAVSANLDPNTFYANPAPAGISTVIIEHSQRSFVWYLERSGATKDHIIKQLYGSARIATRALGAPTRVIVGMEAAGLVLENFKVDPAEIEKCRNELDISINAARMMIPLEAGSDAAKVNALYKQLDEYLIPFQKLEVHSSIRDYASLLLLQNQNARADACKKINDYNQQHRSYAQPHFY